MLAPYLARLSRRQRLVLVGMLLSSALVITLAATLVVATPTTGGAATAGPRPTSAKVQSLTLTALAAPTASTTPPGTWGALAPAFAQAVAFAPGTPTTMLVCGFAQGTLQLARSSDGGKTWTAYRSGVAGQACAVSFSATEAKAVALTITQCAATCGANAAAALYRSVDGGNHWTQAQLPDGGGFGGVLGWAGTTLYATTNDPAHPLAVSVGGAAFVLRDDIARFAGQITALVANGGTMLAVLNAPTTATPAALPIAPTLAQSGNDGLVWSLVAFTDAPFTPTFAHISPDGSLLALEGQDTLVVSRDVGANWQAAAPFAPTETLGADRFVTRTPDGTLVAALQSTRDASKTGIFTLVPGTRTWQPVAAPPAGAQLLTLGWDAAGHPAALWASAGGHLVTLHF